MEPVKSKRILVVDDDEISRSTLADLFEDEGYDVAVANDGLVAEAMLSSYDPHLVVTDLVMPGLDGLGLARRIAQSGRGLPVIIVSSHSTAEIERLAAEVGARGFIRKPIAFADLLELVQSVLA